MAGQHRVVRGRGLAMWEDGLLPDISAYNGADRTQFFCLHSSSPVPDTRAPSAAPCRDGHRVARQREP